MAYDEALAHRVRDILMDEPGLSEKRMFGGLAFLLDGRMALAVGSTGGLMVRIDPTLTDSLIDRPHVRPVEMRGSEMRGWLHVDVEALPGDDALRPWVGYSVDFVRSLPPK